MKILRAVCCNRNFAERVMHKQKKQTHDFKIMIKSEGEMMSFFLLFVLLIVVTV